MSKFKAKFITGTPGHWELYSDGVRVLTFSIQEIAGIYANRSNVVKSICSDTFGDLIVSAARALFSTSPSNIVSLLHRIVQTWVEHPFTKKS